MLLFYVQNWRRTCWVCDEAEAIEFLADLGVQESGLEQIIHKAFDKLGLMSYLRLEKVEVRAWTIRKIQKHHKLQQLFIMTLKKGLLKLKLSLMMII